MSPNSIASSVTRFGEILDIFGNIFNVFRNINILQIYFVFGKILNLLWQIFACSYENFHCCKCPNIEKRIQPFGHTEVSLEKIFRE